MSSPLTEFYNAIISVAEPGTNLIQDSKGNWELEPGTTNDYKAYLKRPTKDPEIIYSLGVNGSSIYFVGYLVEPLYLPAAIILPAKFNATLKFGLTWQTGTFELRPSFSPVELVEEVLGQAIEGFWSNRNK